MFWKLYYCLQDLDIVEQLEFGIRFFDIDTIVSRAGGCNGLETGHGSHPAWGVYQVAGGKVSCSVVLCWLVLRPGGPPASAAGRLAGLSSRPGGDYQLRQHRVPGQHRAGHPGDSGPGVLQPGEQGSSGAEHGLAADRRVAHTRPGTHLLSTTEQCGIL